MFKFFLFCLTLSFNLAAQFRSSDYASRVFLPGPQIANCQDAWSLFANPAGTAFVGGAELVGGYAHHWKNPENLHQIEVASAFGLFKGLSLSLGMALQLPDKAKPSDEGLINGQFGLSFRSGRSVSMGLWLMKQRRYALDSSDPFLLGLGFQYYPTDWLSFGAVSKQIYDDLSAPSEYLAGISLKPFGEKVILFSEARFWPKSKKWSDGYEIDPIAGLRLDLDGVSITGHAIIKDNPLFMFGFDLGFDNFGLGAIGGNEYVGGRFKLSNQKSASVMPAKNKWVQIELNSQGTIKQEFNTITAQLFSKRVTPLFFLESLDSIAYDKSIDGVIIHLEPLDFSFGRAEELRASLTKLREHHKQVVVYLNQAGVEDYYVASAANKIYMNPGATLKLDEFRRNLVYLKGGLDKLGIQAEVIRAGKYKNAPAPLIANKPNKEELEVKNAILDQRYEIFTKALASRSNKSIDLVKKQIDLNRLTAQEAYDFGLVDGILESRDIPEYKHKFSSYFNLKNKETYWGEPDQIAIIPIMGTIVDGKASESFFFRRIETGSDDIIAALDRAVANPHVKGILLRVDSPGGSAFASEKIYQALMHAREHKPIVTSMADIAASGGYFAAAATDSIWAEPSTLTGSIGVFNLSFSAENLFKKYGIHSYELKKGALPGPSIFRPMSEKERKRGQELVNWHYNRFKDSVVRGQNLSPVHVSKIAQGRIWTGQQALDNKLVHKLGGFMDAVQDLKDRSGINKSKPYALKIYRSKHFTLFGVSPFAQLQDLIEHNGEELALAEMTLL